MTTAREWLDAAQALSDAATEGPWAVYQTMHAEPRVVRAGRGVMGTVAVPAHTPDDYGNADAEFIAAARTDVPVMVAALRAVLDPETVEAVARAFDQHTVQDGDRDQDECCCGWRKTVDYDEWPYASDRHLAAVAHAVIVTRIDDALGTVTP